MKILQLSAFLFIVFYLISPVWAAKYQEVAVADGGTIKGHITYNGSVPTRTVLPTKDKTVCGGPRKEPLIEVGANNAVKNVVLFLKEVSKGKAWQKVENNPKIDNVKCRFEPHIQIIPIGKIDITNSDPVLHNTHGYYGKRTAFNVALPKQNVNVTKLLRQAGPVRVDCDAHGWMLGWVYVVENPYFALTGEDGSFSIKDVPPGDYTLVAWQEKLGVKEIPVSVKAKGSVEVPIELKM